MFGLDTPLYLVGLASAAIPLVIHLSRSRKTRTLRFSTTRFLSDQFLRSYRMSRLKELLLLAARMALFALLAITFARPFFDGVPGGADPTKSRSVVIVLDDSASMQYHDQDGSTLLSRASQQAAGIIEELKESDSAAIVLAGRRAGGPQLEYREPTTAREDVANSLLNIAEEANSAQGAPRALGTDLAGGILAADRMLLDREEASHEIYVFSDMQQRGFSEAALAPGEQARKYDAKVIFVPVRPTAAVSNLAITAVQYGASRPMAGIPFAIRPHIRNDGETARDCTVSLFVRAGEGAEDANEEGFRKVAERTVTGVEPDRWRVLTLHHTFHKGGWQAGYVVVDDPRLVADNRRYFSFEVLEAVNVVAVNGAPSSIRRNDELFFLQAALAAGGAETDPIQVTEVRPNAFQAVPLDEVRLVVLANVETLPEAAVGKLERFVDRGGSLLVFLGDQVQPGFYNSRLADPGRLRGGLLPARLTGAGPRGDPKSDQAVARLGDFASDHAALAGFDSGETGSLGGVTLTAYWKLEPAATGTTRVLMATDGGDPLLCERSYGGGRVALFASSCDRDWNNLPVRPAFLPFVYRLFGYLAQEASSQQEDSSVARGSFFQTGQRVLEPLPVGTQSAAIRVAKPDRTSGVFTASADPTARQVEFVETEQPGVYELEAGDRRQSGRTFVVNLEASESDLVPVESGQGASAQVQELLAWENGERITFVDDPKTLSQQAGSGRSRTRLWEILLWVVLVFALLEPALANWITLQHYLKPKVAPKSIPIPTGKILLGEDASTGAAVSEAAETVKRSESVTGAEEAAETPV